MRGYFLTEKSRKEAHRSHSCFSTNLVHEKEIREGGKGNKGIVCLMVGVN
nr:MAG TPA: hypothetical protein [Caudoviricetes sp.]